MIKLISIDIDGTLLTNDHKILPSTIIALQSAYKKGIKIVLNSGRSYPEMQEILKYLPMIEFAICGNGSSVYDVKNNKRIFQQLISSNIIIKLHNQIQDIDHMLEYYDQGLIIAENQPYQRIIDFGLEKYIDFLLATRTIVPSVIEKLATVDKIEKANFNFKSKLHQQNAFEKFKNYTECTFASSFHNNIEVSAKNVNKASGLQFLSSHLNILPNEMMGIGDSGNDIDMLKYVEYKVAMNNAIEELKNIANFITLSNDKDGVAHVINHFINNI